MAKGLGNTKIEERNRNYEASVKQRRNFYIFVAVACIFFSLTIVHALLGKEGNYTDYFWFNPFGDIPKDK